MEYDFKYVEHLTKMSKRVRSDLQNYYSRLSENIRIDIFREQSEIAKNMREERVSGLNAEFTFSAFLLAIRKIRNYEKKIVTKSGVLTPVDDERIKNIRLSRVKNKNKPKSDDTRALIENKFFPLISSLRA